jgi:hypothetical protein
MVAMQMVFQIILLFCSIYAISEEAAGLAIRVHAKQKAHAGMLAISHTLLE